MKNIEIRNSILAGIAFGILFGIFLIFRFGLDYALTGAPISGLLFGLGMYLFVTSRVVKRQTEIHINGQSVLHKGPANHFINGEAVGGELYLLNDRVVFKSHNFNIQNHGQEILISEIDNINFYNTLGIVPNGLEILTTSGHSERFVVNGRKYWCEEINKKTGHNNK